MNPRFSIFFLTLFILPVQFLFAQFDSESKGQLNTAQPILNGEIIYSIVKDGIIYVNNSPVYYVEKIAYINKGVVNNCFNVLLKYEYSDESISPAHKSKTEYLTLPLSPEKKTFLYTQDGQSLMLTLYGKEALNVENSRAVPADLN
ncbi:MAG: hypothetical protein JW734_02825 [Candidatus Omnitrophica bacterium]|nr:hypothetical protein [Candidatus Omnitrophota bacterium]